MKVFFPLLVDWLKTEYSGYQVNRLATELIPAYFSITGKFAYSLLLILLIFGLLVALLCLFGCFVCLFGYFVCLFECFVCLFGCFVCLSGCFVVFVWLLCCFVWLLWLLQMDIQITEDLWNQSWVVLVVQEWKCSQKIFLFLLNWEIEYLSQTLILYFLYLMMLWYWKFWLLIKQNS